jgi:hypothetical protein
MKKYYILLILITVLGVTHPAFAYPFNPQTPTILGGDMHLVESADFNNDGKNDLVVTDGKTMAGIGILYGNGNGTFQAPLILGDGMPYEWGIAVGDIDGQNGPDIVAGNSNLKQLQIYKNTGSGTRFDGTFDVVSLNDPDGTRQADLILADINNDNKLDIIIGTENAIVFEVYINDGLGNFTYSTAGGTGASHGGKGMVAYDYTGDGWKDVIIADESLNQIQFYQNDGTGLFSGIDYTVTSNQVYDVKVADFNTDGTYELIFTSPLDGLTVTSLDGSVTYVNYLGSAYYAKIRDFDGDGNQDILWSDASVTGIQVALGNGDLTFQTPVSYPVNFNPLGVAVNDFDGDGLIDAAAVNHGNTLSIFLTATLPQTAGIWVSPTPILANTDETGPVGTTFQIGLDSEPTDIVEIAFENSDGQLELTKGGSPVTGVCFVPSTMSTTPGTSLFEPCNTWNLGQSITVTPVVDSVSEGTHTGTISFTAITSPDSNYSALALPVNLVTTIGDENDTTAPTISTVRISGPSGSDPDFTATMGADNVILTFFSDEFIDLGTSIITIGGITATCTAPGIISDSYSCSVPASALTAMTAYGQSLDNIEITAKDVSGNSGSTITQTNDGTNVTVLPVIPVDTTSPTLTLSTLSNSVTGSFIITITPSESIVGLDLTDITITNGVASALTGPDGSGNYTVTITPTAAGDVTIQILDSTIEDNASNPNKGPSNILTVNYAPVVIPPSTGGSGIISSGSIFPQVSTIKNNTSPVQIPLPVSCPVFTQYLKKGMKDNSNGITEVSKIQKFLNEKTGSLLAINGIFDTKTFSAVKKYQQINSDKILAPWGLKKPTGRWYQSTRNLANYHAGCSEGETKLDNGNVIKN